MVLARVSRADFPKGQWRARWSAFSMTLAGDIVATVVSIAGICLMFLAAAYAIDFVVRGAAFVFSRLP